MRQDEERRRRKERHDGENTYKKREDEGKKEKERIWEKRKNEHTGDSSGHTQPDKTEKSSKDGKKEENVKKDCLRNKVQSYLICVCLSYMNQTLELSVSHLIR